MKNHFRSCVCWGATALLLTQLASAQAADIAWDANGGTGGNFTTAANWVGDVVPGSFDLARINSNTSSLNPVTFASGSVTVDNINLGSSTPSFMEVNGGTLIALGIDITDFKIGADASQESTFTLSSGTIEFGIAGIYTDSNDFDIGKNGYGRYVQTGGLLQQHADDVKIADSAGGIGYADITGGQMFVADGFSVSDNVGGTGTLIIGGTAEVVSGNSGGLGSNLGSMAAGYVSVANNGGTGFLEILDTGAVYARYLEYKGANSGSATIKVGGTGGKLIISDSFVRGAPAGGNNSNVIGDIASSVTGVLEVRASGTFAVDNDTGADYGAGYVIGRAGKGNLSVDGSNARVVVRQRLLVASGGSDMNFEFDFPGSSTPGEGTMEVGAGGNVAVSELQIGVTGVGTLTQTGGAIVADNTSPLFAEVGFADGVYGEDVVVGSLTGSTGTYTHSGGTLNAKRHFVIGEYGSGSYAMSGTATATAGGIGVARNTGSTGSLTINGGELSANVINVGETGTGTTSVADGKLIAGGGSLFVGGPNDLGTGTLTLNQTGVALSDDDLQFGRVGTGTLNMNVGSYMNGRYTVVGKYGTGTWNQSGGVFFQQDGDLEIGDGGKPDQIANVGPRAGTINFTGGVIDVADTVGIGNRIGSGTVNISGGGLTVFNDVYVGRGMDWTPADVANLGITGNDTELKISGGNAVITIGRDFVMDPNDVFASATLTADITGSSLTPLLIGRNADIGNGTFAVTLNGYTPQAGDQWSIIQTNVDMSTANAEISAIATAQNVPTYYSTTGGVISSDLRFNNDAYILNPVDPDYVGVKGQFANLDFTGASLSAGLSFQVDYTQNAVVLRVVGSSPSDDIVINVASGTQTQSQAGYATISTATSVTKTGAGTVVFDAANGYSGPTTVSAGTLRVANTNGVGSSPVTVDTGATLEIASGTTMRSPSVIVDGGTLQASSVAVNNTTGITALAINAGTIAGAPAMAVGNGGELSLVQDARVNVAVGSLSVELATGGGRVDLGAGQVSVATGGTSAADLRADIIAGRNGGAWDGLTGIMSSAAAASGGTRAVGYVVAVDGSAKVSYAAPGDVDLSGEVNVFDLVSINSSGTYGTGSASVWSQGDFNYDGVTNVFDLVSINTAAAYGQGSYFPATPSASGLGSVAAVPEPATMASVALGVAGIARLMSRRRRGGQKVS